LRKRERKDAVSFTGVFDFFSDCCACVFCDSQKIKNGLAVGGKLLFLYELECEAYIIDPELFMKIYKNSANAFAYFIL